MAKKNAYIQQMKEREQALFEAGRETGLQQMWDVVQLALRDSDAVGKDIFGKERLCRLYDRGIKKYYNAFKLAHTVAEDADYYQEKLDDRLRKIWKDEFVPYKDRYPNIKQRGYGPRK